MKDWWIVEEYQRHQEPANNASSTRSFVDLRYNIIGWKYIYIIINEQLNYEIRI